MNPQERKAALQKIYTISGYYGSIGGVLGIDQWGGLPDAGVAYRVKVNEFLNEQRRAHILPPRQMNWNAIIRKIPWATMKLKLPRSAHF